MRQRLHIARGILHDPPVVFLDEPSIGVDPVGARELRSMIGGLRDAGKTVLLTTHYMFEADELCDRIAVVARGEIVAQGTPRDLKQAVGEGAIVEIEVYGIGDDALAAVRSLDGVTGVVVEERDQAQAIVIQTAVGAEVTQAIMAQLDGVRLGRVTTREPTLEDAYVALVTDHGPDLVNGSRMRQLAAHDDARLEAALQAGVAQPLLPLHRHRHAPDLRDDGVLPLPGWRAAGDARRGRRGLGDDGDLVADDDRRRRGIAAAAAARDPRAPRRLPDAVLGHLPPDHAGDRLDRHLLARTGLIYVRFLFGVPVSVADWPAFIVAVPPTILSIGMLGFLMGSAFVRFRAAWMVGNLFEFPVWTICGFLIPLALLPSWVEPVAWVLAPTWGMSALRNAALGDSAWPDIGMCVLLSIIYAVLGGVLLKAFLRLARERATLGLT